MLPLSLNKIIQRFYGYKINIKSFIIKKFNKKYHKK